MWRLAKSLEQLRSQVNAAYPKRSKTHDGTIGDTAHASRASDHNPNSANVVTAIDITNDPANGLSARKLAETLVASRDPRIKYIISNAQIVSSKVSPWKWRPYTGTNAHRAHVHVSVMADPSLYDNQKPWAINAGQIPVPLPPASKGVTADMRRRMMEAILGYEGRFDGGNLKVFIAPDGLPEIGGVTQKDHPAVYARLKQLLDLGQQAKLKDEILKYYDQYTAAAKDWTDRPGLEFFLRDCILNRGPSGAADILQMAVGVAVDHQVGPVTRDALAALDENVAIDKLRIAREQYEERKYGKANRIAKGQWQGLINRWNRAQAQAHKFSAETGVSTKSISPAATIGAGVGGVGAVVAFGTWIAANPVHTAMFAAGVVMVAAAILYAIRKK